MGFTLEQECNNLGQALLALLVIVVVSIEGFGLSRQFSVKERVLHRLFAFDLAHVPCFFHLTVVMLVPVVLMPVVLVPTSKCAVVRREERNPLGAKRLLRFRTVVDEPSQAVKGEVLRLLWLTPRPG